MLFIKKKCLLYRSSSITPHRKSIRYPGDINISKITPRSSKRALNICRNKIRLQRKVINQLQQNKRRMNKKIESLKELLSDMKEKFKLSDQAVESLEVRINDIVLKV